MVISSNSMMNGMLSKTMDEMKEKKLCDVFPEIKQETWNMILNDGRDYSLQIERNKTLLFTMIAPIIVDEKVEGIIVTCHRMKREQVEKNEKEQETTWRKKSVPVTAQFSDIIQKSDSMQECIRMAKLFSYSE